MEFEKEEKFYSKEILGSVHKILLGVGGNDEKLSAIKNTVFDTWCIKYFQGPSFSTLKFETPPTYLMDTINHYTLHSEERVKQIKAQIEKRLQKA